MILQEKRMCYNVMLSSTSYSPIYFFQNLGIAGGNVTSAIIKEIILCNTSASDVTVDLDFAQDIDAPPTSDVGAIFRGFSLAAKETKIIPLSLVVALSDLRSFGDQSEVLFGKASSDNSVTVRISGVEKQS